MKTKTFFIDTPFEMNRQTASSDHTTASGVAELNSADATTNLNLGEEKTTGVRHSIWLKYRIEDLHPQTRIGSARIILSPSASSPGGTVDIACLRVDGRWNHTHTTSSEDFEDLSKTINTGIKLTGSVSGDLGGFRLEEFGVGVRGQNDEDQITSDDNIRLNYLYTDIRDGARRLLRSVAQIVKIDTTEDIDLVRVRLSRVGDAADIPGTGVYAYLWKLDPTTFENLGLVRQTISNPVLYTTLTAGGASSYASYAIGFPILAVTAGEVYAVEIKTNGGEVYSTNHVIVGVALDSGSAGLDDDELIYLRGPHGGFTMGDYPTISDLPFLYTGDSGTTLNTPPHNSIISTTFNSAGAQGTVYFDVTQILQEWVNSAQYKNNRDNVVGFVMDSADHFATNTVLAFRGNDIPGGGQSAPLISLEVTYEPRRVHVS